MLDALKTTYNLPRLLFPIHWEGISHQPKPVRWDKEDIDNLKSKLKHHYAGLKAMGVDTFQHVAAYYAVSSFDKRLLEHWQNYLGVGDNPPTLDDVIDFLGDSFKKIAGSQWISPTSSFSTDSSSKSSSSRKKARSFATHSRDYRPVCTHCNIEGHRIHQCSNFKRKTVEQHKEHIRESKLCFNCLTHGHVASVCQNRGKCRSCGRGHHTLLHEEPSPANEAAHSNQTSAKPILEASKCISATALVDIRTECRCQTGRVFFDGGSQISMMTKQKAQELQARLVPCLMSINGVGPAPLTSHFKTTVLLESLHDPDETPVTVSCHVVEHLSPVNNNLNIDVHRKLMKEHKLEPIADPCPGDKAAVDILLSHADGYACRKGPDLLFPSLRCGE